MEEKVIIQQLSEPLFEEKGVKVYIKRDDLLHPEISGNKWWKLKYNLAAAKAQGKDTIITFGGAYSNHIAATAAACRDAGLKSIGLIRGEEHAQGQLNPTLSFAAKCGMQLFFISRDLYRRKDLNEIIQWLQISNSDNDTELPGCITEPPESPVQPSGSHAAPSGRHAELVSASHKHQSEITSEVRKNIIIIPEGGGNELGVKGCTEILNGIDVHYDIVCCACGTGTTLSGIILSKPEHVRAIGFSALKGGEFLYHDVELLIHSYCEKLNIEFSIPTNWIIETESHLGGYAKVNDALKQFVKAFYSTHNILLDYIYTGKMMMNLYEKISADYFPTGTSVLVIHSGGTQGNVGVVSGDK
jgi:1-aminocyclopropane-1-carboxylate deaminase